MKEYITQIIYENSPLIIGTNGKSIIIGDENQWVILDKYDIKHINAHISGVKMPEIYNTKIVSSKDEILISQGQDCVTLSKNLFGNLSCAGKI